MKLIELQHFIQDNAADKYALCSLVGTRIDDCDRIKFDKKLWWFHHNPIRQALLRVDLESKTVTGIHTKETYQQWINNEFYTLVDTEA